MLALGMLYAVRNSVWFIAILLAGASSCAAEGVEIEPDSAVETGTCEHVLTGDVRPTLDVPTRMLGEQYSPTLTHTFTISSALPAANQEAAIAAVDAWREAAGGYLDLQAQIGETECDMPYAVHAAPQGECHLSGNDEKGYRVGFYKTRFGIVLRNTTAEGRVPSPAETYAALMHEIGHALGLAHKGGGHIMNPALSAQIAHPTVRETHLAKIAERFDWPAQDMQPGTYLWARDVRAVEAPLIDAP